MNSAFHQLFLDELSALFDAEQQLVAALPKVAAAATNPKLKMAIQDHLQETQGHVANLQQAFSLLGGQVVSKSCPAMAALIQEAEELIAEGAGGDSDVLDAGLIGGAQKVEHHEIACYGTLATWARQMGHDEVLDLLKENLAQEKAADEKLTTLAESSVNDIADGGDGGGVMGKVEAALGMK